MKRIFVIATGGTIAGVGEAGGQRYRSGELGVGALLESAPELAALAQIEALQLANIGSQDMSEALWFALAAEVAERLEAEDCDGVVIIHGTDTLEETAFFLHCVLPQTRKPVVLTGAMRPATDSAADGPRNLAAAVAVAASDASEGRGVLVVFADHIFAAADVSKIHTQALAAFSAGGRGAAGSVTGAEVAYLDASVGADGVPWASATAFAALPCADLAVLVSQPQLPKVAVVTAHVGQLPEQIESLVQLGFRGIVYAGLGNGNFSAVMLSALKAAQARGVVVVRATRVPFGGVSVCGEVDDHRHGLVCAGNLSPQQARILLALALAYTDDVEQIRRWFAPYAQSQRTTEA